MYMEKKKLEAIPEIIYLNKICTQKKCVYYKDCDHKESECWLRDMKRLNKLTLEVM